MFRRWVLLTHRWMGLVSSIVLSIAGVTGALLLMLPSGRLRGINGRLHESLALGRAGRWIVLAASLAGALLALGGVILWWRRKAMRVRWNGGWPVLLSDLHHPVGIVGLLLMLILSVSALGLAVVTPQSNPAARRVLMTLHTSGDFGFIVDTVYFLGSMCFAVQGLSGIVMWWRTGPFTKRP